MRADAHIALGRLAVGRRTLGERGARLQRRELLQEATRNITPLS